MRHVTVATEIGFKPIVGANHTKPYYHYKLTPGTAYKKLESGYDVVPVDAALCKKAHPTHMLFWIEGRTVTEFNIDGTIYAQPIVEDARAKPPKEKPKKIKEARGVAPPVPAAPPEPAPKRPPPKEPTPAPPEKRAKGLRKKGYKLDF